MAQITKSIAETNRLAAMLVPAEIVKAISQDELVDRLAEAKRLGERAADPSVRGDLRTAYKMRARAVLSARPRDAVAREHAALITKAAQLPNAQVNAVREHARRLIEEEQPPAPRLGVRKAKAKAEDPPVPVFDSDGRLIGIVDPGDITPVAGTGEKTDSAPAPAPAPAPAAQAPAANGQQAAGAAPDGQVAKASGRQVIVYDQFGRRHVTRQGSIRRSAVRKMAADDLVAVRDMHGREYQVSRAVLRSPEEQARNTGPVSAGGTTGMGRPRVTGPAAALPGDGPQERRPGGVADRTVVKAAAAASWVDVHDWTGRLVGVVKQSDIITGGAAQIDGYVKKAGADNFANVYNAAKRRVGVAHLASILPVRTGGR